MFGKTKKRPVNEKKLVQTNNNAVKAIPRPKNLTRILIKYDVGFGNTLSIRGHGLPGISWEKGVSLRNTKANEWLFETPATFTLFEFKVLLNDKVYETGPNHCCKCGSDIQYTPHF